MKALCGVWGFGERAAPVAFCVFGCERDTTVLYIESEEAVKNKLKAPLPQLSTQVLASK